MKRISLTQGKSALVDDEDFERLNQYRWCAARKENTFYACRRLEHKNVYMARIIMDCPSNLEVDHIDSNPLNNQRSNLRICTRQENATNCRSLGGISKYRGVSFVQKIGNWRARIYTRDIFNQLLGVSLGSFSIEKEAALAYDKAARYYFGEFAALNFPRKGEKSCLL